MTKTSAECSPSVGKLCVAVVPLLWNQEVNLWSTDSKKQSLDDRSRIDQWLAMCDHLGFSTTRTQLDGLGRLGAVLVTPMESTAFR